MYNYQDFKHKFGQDDLEIKMLKIYDYMEKGKQYSTEGLFFPVSGDSWETLACIDRLVELKLINLLDYSKIACRNFWQYTKI